MVTWERNGWEGRVTGRMWSGGGNHSGGCMDGLFRYRRGLAMVEADGFAD